MDGSSVSELLSELLLLLSSDASSGGFSRFLEVSFSLMSLARLLQGSIELIVNGERIQQGLKEERGTLNAAWLVGNQCRDFLSVFEREKTVKKVPTGGAVVLCVFC